MRFGLEAALGGQLLDFGASLRFLLRRVEEDGGAVLRAPVRTLPVERGGVVELEECIEQLLVAHFFRVEVEFDHFGVAGLVGAHIFVGGLVERAALIADGRRRHAGNRRKRGLHAPKTSCSKCRFFYAHNNLMQAFGFQLLPICASRPFVIRNVWP